MNTIIDMGSEVLVDRSKVHAPYLRMLLEAIGQPIARGSAWVAVNKKVAALFQLTTGGALRPIAISAA